MSGVFSLMKNFFAEYFTIFAFPRIGAAVALRPGDFLLFNPHDPHSIR